MDATNYQNETDFNLLKSTGYGDQHAFETLYKRFECRLFHYLRMMVNDDTLAEDVLIEAMVAVWKGAKTFQGGSQVSTWIFGIARHKALDALRGRMAKGADSLSLDEASEVPDPKDRTAIHAEQSMAGTILKKALAMLSPEHQEAIHLAFYEGLSYQEIAGLMDVPINTIKTRVYYAKQKLKTSLESLGLEENPL